MKSYKESGYEFQFDGDWNVIKYDDHRFYKILSGHDMSGVDFAGMKNRKEVYLIEIKNYNQYRGAGITKPINEFVDEIVEKGRDSLQLITVIMKFMERKFWYRAFYSFVRRFTWLQPEWYFWTELYRMSIVEKKAIFVLLIDADYDMNEITKKVKNELKGYYGDIIIKSISGEEILGGVMISKLE